MSVPYLWDKHAAESHRGTEADTEAHGDDLVVGAKVNRNKGQPDDTSGVHGKGNILGLIKIGRNITSLQESRRKEGSFKAERRGHTVMKKLERSCVQRRKKDVP